MFTIQFILEFNGHEGTSEDSPHGAHKLNTVQ
jgi:hypothetical protein